MRPRNDVLVALLSILLAVAQPATAEDADSPSASPAPASHQIGSFTINGEVRARGEGWNWFYKDNRQRYAFGETLLNLALSQRRRNFQWKVELAQPSLINLPQVPSSPGAQAQFGLGGTYASANNFNRDAAALYLKQAYVSFTGLRHNGGSLQLGLFDFAVGLEERPHELAPAFAFIWARARPWFA